MQEKDGRLFAIKSQESRRIEFARNRKKNSMTYMTRPRIVVWTVRARDRGQKMNKYSSELGTNGIFREIKAAQHCIVVV